MTTAQKKYFNRIESNDPPSADEWCPCITCGDWVMSELDSTQSELGWEHDKCRADRLREAA